MTAIDPKTYAQLASRVYDRKDIRNKMTLPQDFTELGWQNDDPLTGFSANTDSGCLTNAFPLRKTSVRQPESYMAA